MDSFGRTDARLLMIFAASLLVLVAAARAVASRDEVVELATITDAVDSDLPGHLDLLSVTASLVGNHSLRWEIRTRGPLLPEGTPEMAHLVYRVFVDLDEPFITGSDFAAADRDLSAELQVTSQLQYVTNSLAHGFEIDGDTLWLTSFLPSSLREERRVAIVVDAVDWDSGAFDQTLAVTLQLPQLDLTQSPGQQACINALNRGGARVAAAQGRENVACIKGAARGRVENPAACLRADAKGTVARAAARTSLHERRRCGCDTPPRFGVANHAAVARAARATSAALVEDVFGADLAGTIIRCDADTHGCACQRAVSRDLEPIAAAQLRAFRLCAKTALKNGATDRGTLERCVADVATPWPITTAAGNRIARKVARLRADIRQRCAHNVFAGVCASMPVEHLATCIDQRVNCRICQMINAMDNLDASCDLLDDALANGSCTPTHVARGLGSLGSLVVLGDADAAAPFRVGPFFADLLRRDLEAR
ncbi:MAG: hypothetical protein ACE5I7_07500, partial [Candidatus Binatia bacterium]